MPRTIVPGTPGVVVVQQIWGVDAQLRDVVRRFAKAGYIAIAPALFDREHPPSTDTPTDFTVFAPIATKMNADGFVPTDLAAARAWIRGNASRSAIGIIGFCMGGGITLQSLVATDDYKAASMMYGSVRVGTDPKAPTTASTFAFADKITTPLLGSFGARDTSIKAEDVAALFSRLHAPHAVKIYDEAGHAFFDDTRERYIPSAAADAWTRTLAWFAKYLV
jgi:carboxymethylenebutenolidase